MFLYTFEENDKISKAERLFVKYKNAMFCAAFSILKDTHLADDAVSQSFVKLLKNMDKIDEENEKKTSSYMAMVCKNIAINMLKKNIYLNIEDDVIDKIEDRCNYNNIDPSEIIQERESFNLLIDYINSLDGKYKEVMILKYYHDLENKEIAYALGVKESTVRKRLIRGKEILMKLLKKSGEYEIE